MKFNKPDGSKRIWKSKLAWIILGLVLAGGGAAWYFLNASSNQAKAASMATTPQYHTSSVTRGDIRVSAAGTGTLVVNKSINLSFSSEGQVTELNVRLGDKVKAGDVLAKMGTNEALKARVANYNLQYLQARKSLDDMQANKDVSLATAYQTYVKAKQAYNTALNEYQRSAYPRCSDEVNTRNAEALKLAKDQLEQVGLRNYGSDAWINIDQKYLQALDNYNYCITYTADEKTNYKAALDVADVTMKQAEATFNTLKGASGIDPQALVVAEAKVDQLKTQLDAAIQDLEGATLISPMDGTVTYVLANQGAVVDTSVFLTVADLAQSYVQVSVNETDLGMMVIGNKVEIVFDAVPEKIYTGTIVRVEPALVASGNYNVVRGMADLPKESLEELHTLPLGLNAAVTVISKEAKDTLLVPVEAIRDLGNKEYGVFVMGSDGKLKLKPVKVGLTNSTEAEILSGLNEGDTVTTGIIPTSAKN